MLAADAGDARVAESLPEATQEDAIDEKVDWRGDEFEHDAQLVNEESYRRTVLVAVFPEDLDAFGGNVADDEDEYNDDHNQRDALLAGLAARQAVCAGSKE